MKHLTQSPDPALHRNDEPPFDEWLNCAENLATASDCLGREFFSERLATTLANLPGDRSIVTAVFGSWGSGKTWILEKTSQQLEREYYSQISLCRFSPWELKSQDQILTEFFAAIKEKLPATSKKSKSLVALWDRLGAFTQVGSAGVLGSLAALQLTQVLPDDVAKSLPSLLAAFSTLVSTAASGAKSEQEKQNLTLLETKAELTKRLAKELKRPILVIIDDLDRLPDAEIQLMIRLLNTTANLPKLHYLIFGDRRQIARALNPICGGHGDLYLEKLIQNTFQVPEPGENRIREQLWQGLRRLCSRDEIDSGHLATRFSMLWDHAIKYRIRQLRDCHRLLRTLHFHVKSLTRDDVLEVDLIDLLAIDFIRVFDADFYNSIALEPPTGKAGTFIWFTAEEKKDSLWLISLIEKSSLERRAIVGILLFLFPTLTQFFRQFLEKTQLAKVAFFFSKNPSPLGINSPERTHFYFTLLLSGSDMPEADIRRFAEAHGSVAKMIQMLGSFRENGWIPQLLGRLCSDESIFSSREAGAHLLQAISSVSDSFESVPGAFEDELRLSIDLCRVLIRRMANGETESLVIPAIENSPAYTLPLVLIEFSRSASGKTYGESMKAPWELKPFSEQTLDQLSDLVLSRVQEAVRNGSFIILKSSGSLFYRLANALGPKRGENCLRSIPPVRLATDVSVLIGTIALSLQPRIMADWNLDPSASQAGMSLLAELRKFASDNFWAECVDGHLAELDQRRLPWLPHLRAALRAQAEESSSVTEIESAQTLR